MLLPANTTTTLRRSFSPMDWNTGVTQLLTRRGKLGIRL
jgi:hypothetical protein